MKTDLDLPPAYRTQANYWKMKFLEMREEVVKCNKGIRRLKKADQLAVRIDRNTDRWKPKDIIHGPRSRKS